MGLLSHCIYLKRNKLTCTALTEKKGVDVAAQCKLQTRSWSYKAMVYKHCYMDQPR